MDDNLVARIYIYSYIEFHDVPCVYIYTGFFLDLAGDIPTRITNVWLLGIPLILYVSLSVCCEVACV